jgi:hypothetical protein
MNRAAVALFALSVSAEALACPVCGGGGKNAWAFFDMTIFMSAVPLVMLGGGVGFLYWRYRQLAEVARLDPDVTVQPVRGSAE